MNTDEEREDEEDEEEQLTALPVGALASGSRGIGKGWPMATLAIPLADQPHTEDERAQNRAEALAAEDRALSELRGRTTQKGRSSKTV